MIVMVTAIKSLLIKTVKIVYFILEPDKCKAFFWRGRTDLKKTRICADEFAQKTEECFRMDKAMSCPHHAGKFDSN